MPCAREALQQREQTLGLRRRERGRLVEIRTEASGQRIARAIATSWRSAGRRSRKSRSTWWRSRSMRPAIARARRRDRAPRHGKSGPVPQQSSSSARPRRPSIRPRLPGRSPDARWRCRPPCLRGRGEGNFLAAERHGPGVGQVAAGDDLDERRLSGAVRAHQRDLAGSDDSDPRRRARGPERFLDAGDGKGDGGWGCAQDGFVLAAIFDDRKAGIVVGRIDDAVRVHEEIRGLDHRRPAGPLVDHARRPGQRARRSPSGDRDRRCSKARAPRHFARSRRSACRTGSCPACSHADYAGRNGRPWPRSRPRPAPAASRSRSGWTARGCRRSR